MVHRKSDEDRSVSPPPDLVQPCDCKMYVDPGRRADASESVSARLGQLVAVCETCAVVGPCMAPPSMPRRRAQCDGAMEP